MIYEVLIVIYLLVALALVGLVLMQQGKGADMGASFGAGSSNTLFGSSGSGNFLTRSTATLAVLFFILSLAIGNLSNTGNSSESDDDLDYLQNKTEQTDQSQQQPASDIPAAAAQQQGHKDVPQQQNQSDVPNPDVPK